MTTKVISKLKSLNRPFLFGMIHVPALPGTPKHRLTMLEILKIVEEEAKIYSSEGIDGIIVENMHDLPYCRAPIGPEIVASMTSACQRVAEAVGPSRKDLLLGIQILAAANQEAIAVAKVTGFDLIRAEGFAFSHVGDEGWIDACAGPLLRYRRMIGADDIAVFTDIKKKHSAHAVTTDVSITETAQAAEFFHADGVIITGNSTGHAADPKELQDNPPLSLFQRIFPPEVKAKASIAVLIGSGVTLKNMNHFSSADGFIVGSEFKENGHWANKLDPIRVRKFIRRLKTLQNK